MLDLLVKSAVRRKVIGLFALNPGQELYARQVAGEIAESPHAVGLELRYLTEGGLISKIARGRRDYYCWNAQFPFADLLRRTVQKMRSEGNAEMRAIPDLEQRQRIAKNLERIVADICRYYNPEKILVFGSAASGNVGPYSDIDLVVIKRTTLPSLKRVQQLVQLLDYDVDIDFFVYTPEEFEEAVRERRFFQREIVEKGKVLYDKAA